MEKETTKCHNTHIGRPERERSLGFVDTKADVDRRSIFVRNVHYGASVGDVRNHFENCGTINRVTIPLNSFTGRAKG